MRTVILVLLLSVACREDEPAPKTGCSLGIRIGEEHEGYQLIRCATKEQHAAGNNTQAGGIAYFANYKQWKWEPVNNCSECDKYRK